MISKDSKSTKSDLTIKAQYLVQSNYQQIIKNNQQINIWYNDLCDIFISHYSILCQLQLKTEGAQKNRQKIGRRKTYQFTRYLREFMETFVSVMKEVSIFQVKRLNQLKQHNSPQFSIYQSLKKSGKQAKIIIQQIKEYKQQLAQLFKNIKVSFTTYIKNIQNPYKFYDQNYASISHQQIQSHIQTSKKVIESVLGRIGKLQIKIGQFQRLLTKFKCKLVKNKYNILNKLSSFIQNSKYSIIQIAQFFKFNALRHKQIFIKVLSRNQDDITELKQLLMSNENQIQLQDAIQVNKIWSQAIKSTLIIYCKQNLQIQSAVKELSTCFALYIGNHEAKSVKLKEIIQNISLIYDENQSPLEQLKQLYLINENLQRKFKVILQRLNQIVISIKKNQKKCVKHTQIILSLIKMKNEKNEGFLQNSDSINKKQIKTLVDQMTFFHTKEHILLLYESCIMTQNDLLEAIQVRQKARRKTLDSMDISHSISTDRYLVNKKKPFKEQYWLWRDFTEEINFKEQYYEQEFNEINKFIQETSLKFIIKDNMQLQNYKCFIPKLKQNAILKINSGSVQIEAEKIKINIAWKDVLNIQENTSFFNKGFAINTGKGKIVLSKFEKGQKNIIASIKQIQQKSLMVSSSNIQRKKQIILTPNQIKDIQQRRQKIKSQIPSTDGFKLVIKQCIEDARIDQIYDMIYSDKTFDFYGRQQPCFMSYLGKKAGNFNWKAEKFDKPGPQFYTLQQGITFINCPIFSTRMITYTHPMKPTSIPFMPKVSRHADERIIYWVSHEQFIFLIKAKVFDVPFADAFEVNMIHRITKMQEMVQIQLYSKIIFVKETSFKNIIFNSSDPQIDANMFDFIKEIKKVVQLSRQAAKGIKVQVQEQLQVKSVPSSPENEINRLKLYNKILLLGLITILILNLLNII